MRIVLTLPEGAPPNLEWLRLQLEHLQVITDRDGDPYLKIYGGTKRRNFTEADFGSFICHLGIVVTIETWNGNGTMNVLHQVGFLIDGTSRINPALHAGDVIMEVDAPWEHPQLNHWINASWGDGLASLTRRLASLCGGYSEGQCRQIESAVRMLSNILPAAATVRVVD